MCCEVRHDGELCDGLLLVLRRAVLLEVAEIPRNLIIRNVVKSAIVVALLEKLELTNFRLEVDLGFGVECTHLVFRQQLRWHLEKNVEDSPELFVMLNELHSLADEEVITSEHRWFANEGDGGSRMSRKGWGC